MTFYKVFAEQWQTLRLSMAGVKKKKKQGRTLIISPTRKYAANFEMSLASLMTYSSGS